MRNQARLISLVLQHIQQQTGYQIVASSGGLQFGPHLIVLLEHPIIQHDGRELIRSERIRVYLSYHALIWSNGLPLRALVIVRPELRAPAASAALGPHLLPRPDTAAVRAVAQEFREFSGLVERVTIANARISDATGQPLVEEFSLTAAPRRRHSKIWNIGFLAPHIHTALSGLEVSGRISDRHHPACHRPDYLRRGTVVLERAARAQTPAPAVTVNGARAWRRDLRAARQRRA